MDSTGALLARNIDFLILSNRAGGTGVTLCAATRMILFDSDPNLSRDTQVVARVYRLGSQQPVHITQLYNTDAKGALGVSYDAQVYQPRKARGDASNFLLDRGPKEDEGCSVAKPMVLN